MTKFIKSVSVLLLAFSFLSYGEDISLKVDKGFELKASYYPSVAKSDRAVLMLHQCNYNRSMYNDIGQQLAKQGIHALSIDFRGFGESITNEFNVDKIQKLPREERRKAWQAMSAYWPSDVQLAYTYLKNKLSEKADIGVIGVIGASCGGSQAITLAENNLVKVISFFSSGQRKDNIERYKKVLGDKPTLIIASEEDGGTYTSAQALFTAAKNKDSRFIAYKGNEHGYPLLTSDVHLATTIVSWFDQQLIK